MDDVPAEADLESKRDQLTAVSAELDREIGSHADRAAAMEQRATILVGAATVVGALQVSPDSSISTVLNLALSFTAAVAGVIVVFPRRGRALDVRRVRDGLLEMQPLQGTYKLVEVKLRVLEADERWLTARGWIARVGFIALALSIAVALWGALTTAPAGGGTASAVVDEMGA